MLQVLTSAPPNTHAGGPRQPSLEALLTRQTPLATPIKSTWISALLDSSVNYSTISFESVPALAIAYNNHCPLLQNFDKFQQQAIMAMAAENGPMASTVIYQEVKAWIAQQEAFEAQYNKPAPLTDAQRMALQNLRLPTATPSPTPSSPSPAFAGSSGVNYVGILMG